MGSSGRSSRSFRAFTAMTAALALSCPAEALAAGSPAPPASGGGALAPPPAKTVPASSPLKSATPAPPGPHTNGVWLSQVTISEYWPVPESWFKGALVSAPGIPGKHRVDWLYSASGVSMNGQGIGLDGQLYHVARLGAGGWVTAVGRTTDPGLGWLGGTPFWRSGGYWRNGSGAVTFPLATGGWFAGAGRSYVPLPGVSFASGPALGLQPYQSIAVDPRVIPLGSRVYIPAYRNDGHGGWFVAQDTGGAIVGHRVDVYRTPPAIPFAGGQYLRSQRIFVVRPAS